MTTEEMIKQLESIHHTLGPVARVNIAAKLRAAEELAKHVNGRYSDKGLQQPFADKLWELGKAYERAGGRW